MPRNMVVPMGGIPVQDQVPAQQPAQPGALDRINTMRIGAERSKLTADLMDKLQKQGGPIRSNLHGVGNAIVNAIGGYNTAIQADKNAAVNKELINMLAGEQDMTDLDRYAAMTNPAMFVQQRVAHANAMKLAKAKAELDARTKGPGEKVWNPETGQYEFAPGVLEMKEKELALKDKYKEGKDGADMKYGDFEKMQESITKANAVEQLSQGFKPEYAGYMTKYGYKAMRDLAVKGWLPRNLVGGENIDRLKEASAWWARLEREHDAIIRHNLFGSAFTASEQASWDRMTVDASNDPATVMNYLYHIRNGARTHMRGQRDYLLKFKGASPEQMTTIFGQGYDAPDWQANATMEPNAATGQYEETPGGKLKPGQSGQLPGEGKAMRLRDPSYAKAAEMAKRAIGSGKDPQAVLNRMREMGFKDAQLEDFQ